MQTTLREHSGNIQGTFGEYSENILGNFQGTSREHCISLKSRPLDVLKMGQVMCRGVRVTHWKLDCKGRAEYTRHTGVFFKGKVDCNCLWE
jgi:hypothetical protein